MIPLDFGPKLIFSSKDAAKGRNIIDSFFVGKISYYMVTPTTSFCDAESKEKNLVGEANVCKYRKKPSAKTFFWYRALWWPKKLLPLALSSSFVGHRELPAFLSRRAGHPRNSWPGVRGTPGIQKCSAQKSGSSLR